jgi:GNAT superfamily N-acetyltransferase
MPLELRPMSTPDALSWVRVRSLAYYGPTHDLLHTGRVRDSSIVAMAEDRKGEIGTPNMWHWKIVDTSLPPSNDDPVDNGGRTIATAVWSLHNLKQQEGEEGKMSMEPSSIPAEKIRRGPRRQSFLPPELRLDALSSIFGPLDDAREEIMGTEKPYFMLNGLSTHPEHQGRGAAGILLEWGLNKADKEGLITYLDATEMARPIYERRGFELKKGLDWDRVPWGGQGKDWHGCMVRQPRTGNKPLSNEGTA